MFMFMHHMLMVESVMAGMSDFWRFLYFYFMAYTMQSAIILTTNTIIMQAH